MSGVRSLTVAAIPARPAAAYKTLFVLAIGSIPLYNATQSQQIEQ